MKTEAQIKAECPTPDFEEWLRQRSHPAEPAQPAADQTRKSAATSDADTAAQWAAYIKAKMDEAGEYSDALLKEVVAELLHRQEERNKLLTLKLEAALLKVDTVVAQRHLDHVRLEVLERQASSPLLSSTGSHTGTAH
jgi:hypothetical protein